MSAFQGPSAWILWSDFGKGNVKFVQESFLHVKNLVFWPRFSCHCFVIREHMLERGEGPTSCQSNIIAGSHWSVTDSCHACQSSVCVCVHARFLLCACPLFIVCFLTLCIFASVCLLPQQTCQSSIPSGISLPMIAKGGVSMEWQREEVREEQKNRKNRWSESHRCLHSFLLVCQWVFSSLTIQKHKCGTALFIVKTCFSFRPIYK